MARSLSGDVNAPSGRCAAGVEPCSCREIATASVRFADPAGHQIANIFLDHRRPWFVYVMQEPFRDVLGSMQAFLSFGCARNQRMRDSRKARVCGPAPQRWCFVLGRKLRRFLECYRSLPMAEKQKFNSKRNRRIAVLIGALIAEDPAIEGMSIRLQCAFQLAQSNAPRDSKISIRALTF